jgi:type II secretory pathway component GspD/PulD (secretin)
VRTDRPILIPALLLLSALGAPLSAQDGDQPPVDPTQLEDLVNDWGESTDTADEPRSAPRSGIRRPGANTTPAARPEPTVSFGVFSEPIELTTLIDYVGSALNINIVVKGTPTGEIVFNAPVEVPKSKLIDLLDAMLEQYNYTITNEAATGFWIVQPITDIKPNPSAERASMQIIPTPNIKPSLIVPALSSALGSGFGGVPGQGGGGGGALQAIDELGVIIINAPARDISRIKTLVDSLLQIDENQRYIRFELDHLAAPVARDRAVGLSGGTSNANNPNNRQFNPQNNQQGGAVISGGSLSNIGDRLAIDPQGNALIFKGTEQEIARVQSLLKVIDVPNTLEPKSYFAGSSAAQIADIAARRGLGEVIQISDNNDVQNAFGGFRGNQFNNQQFNNTTSSVDTTGGPVMVVDTSRGNIIYYGTETQQRQLANLMDELDTEDERVVIREVVLDHSDADTVADLMTAIITGEQRTGDSDFLPGSSGTRNTNPQAFNPFFQGAGGTAGSDVNAAFDPDLVSITSDPDNNQVIVKAPIKQQDELARLIKRLDRRKPQVYIQAMIVSVEDSENFRLAIESQLSAGDFQSQTNFGLSSAGTGASFTDQRSVATGLAGLTQAVILSNQIPLILNATQTDTDVRILSTPQLLVNDNQESEIVSIREEPYTEISRDSGNADIVTFGGFAEAGTTLRVTPSISDGGFMRLEYYVELSNFTSASGSEGSPPPRQTNTLTGNATIPSDGTIIIGGITIENARDTVMKVPLLGDIPLLGLLFRDTSKITTDSKIYVFLTPRIMTDPNFQDLRLLSEGPYAEMDLDPEVPDLKPAIIGSTAVTRDDTPLLPEAPRRDDNNDAPTLTPAIIAPSDRTSSESQTE